MTTDDVPSGDEGARSSGSPSDVDSFWQLLYAQLDLSKQIPREDAVRFKSVIESGGEVGFAMNFDVAADGAVRNFVLVESTGIPSLDAELSKLAKQRMPSVRVAAKDVGVEAGLTRERLRFALAIEAPTIADAERFESEMQKARDQVSLPASQRELLDSIVVTRTGQRVRLDVNLPIAAILEIVRSAMQ
jgi:hypothetical protein